MLPDRAKTCIIVPTKVLFKERGPTVLPDRAKACIIVPTKVLLMLWLPPPRPLENVPAWQSPRSKEGRQWCQNCLHLAILVHSIPSVGTKDWRDAQLCRIISYLPGEEAKLASDADNTLLMQYFPPKYHVKILFSSLSKNC